jgi:Histidine kinase-, DNA gyrase B-, and HSP90-like ATPase
MKTDIVVAETAAPQPSKAEVGVQGGFSVAAIRHYDSKQAESRTRRGPRPPSRSEAAIPICVDFPKRSKQRQTTAAQGSIVVRLEHVEENVVCGVSDTGEGIPDDKLEAIFDRFVQLTKNDRRGVGLGLFISKCIVQGHGGRIWVVNRMGGGSTFCFSLPSTRTDDGREDGGIYRELKRLRWLRASPDLPSLIPPRVQLRPVPSR